MRLLEIINKVNVIEKINFFDFDIEEICDDSREVYKRCLFFAIKGNNTDGNKYIDEAIKRGAVAVVTETPSDIKVCQIIVKDIRLADRKSVV